MNIAILTFDEFNELDSLIAFGILNRVKKNNWQISIAGVSPSIKSMNNVVIQSHISIDQANYADVVIFGSGMKTREIANDPKIMKQLNLDPQRQLIASQCSGVLLLSKLGLLKSGKACTDLTTKPWVEEAGISVLNQSFYADGNVATAGGCLSSIYLAAWVIARSAGIQAARDALYYVAPVHEKEEYVAKVFEKIGPFLKEKDENISSISSLK